MIPQSSPTATSQFQSTYAGLEAKFAQMVSEVDKGMGVQSQQVRQDAGLLALVGQLRQSGAWRVRLGRPQERRQPGLCHLGLPGADAHRLRPLPNHRLHDRITTTTPAGGQWPAGSRGVRLRLGAGYTGLCRIKAVRSSLLDRPGAPRQTTIPASWSPGTGVCAYDRVPANSRSRSGYPRPRNVLLSAGQVADRLALWLLGGCRPLPSVAMNTWGFNSQISGNARLGGRVELRHQRHVLAVRFVGSAARRRRGPPVADQARPAAVRAPAGGARPGAAAGRGRHAAAGCGWRARRSGSSGCCSSAGPRRAHAPRGRRAPTAAEADAATRCSGAVCGGVDGLLVGAGGAAARPGGGARR